jgi:hypothetical protein
MAQITGTPSITPASLYSSSTNPDYNYELGQLVFGKNGKAFRYVKAGELLVVGDVYQGSVIDTQFNELVAIASPIVSAQQVAYVTNGTTVVAAGDFVGGTAIVAVTPDIGNEYTIVGHSTAANGATLTLFLDRPLGTAWTTSTRVTLRRSPWSAVIKAATTLTACVAGVAIYPVASGEYGWLQTKGVAAVYSDSSTFAAGSDVGVPGAAAGQIGVNVAGTGKCNTVGRAMQANSSGKPVPVYLFID